MKKRIYFTRQRNCKCEVQIVLMSSWNYKKQKKLLTIKTINSLYLFLMHRGSEMMMGRKTISNLQYSTQNYEGKTEGKWVDHKDYDNHFTFVFPIIVFFFFYLFCFSNKYNILYWLGFSIGFSSLWESGSEFTYQDSYTNTNTKKKKQQGCESGCDGNGDNGGCVKRLGLCRLKVSFSVHNC